MYQMPPTQGKPHRRESKEREVVVEGGFETTPLILLNSESARLTATAWSIYEGSLAHKLDFERFI
jgi:hypothetical protein